MEMKSPINILQEYFCKQNLVPQYIFVPNCSSNFICRVSCDNMVCEGQGLSKKEAKRKAAEHLIEKIGEEKVKGEVFPLQLFERKNSENVLPLLLSLNKSVDDSIVQFNYIGRIQEFCVQHRLSDPIYETIEITGPPHLQIFKMSCTISSLNITEVASGNSKKITKQEVAKKIFHRLFSNSVEDKNTIKKYSNINIPANTCSLEEMLKAMNIEVHDIPQSKLPDVEYIQQNYKKLTVNKVLNFTEGITVDDYPFVLQSKFNEEIRQKFIGESEKFIDSIQLIPVQNVIHKFEKLLSIIDVKSNIIKYTSNTSDMNEAFVVGVQLDTVPIISEIDYNASWSTATIGAIRKIVTCLNFLFS